MEILDHWKQFSDVSMIWHYVAAILSIPIAVFSLIANVLVLMYFFK